MKIGSLAVPLMLALLALPGAARAQSWSGQSNGTASISNPYMLCFTDGFNLSRDACFTQGGANTVKLIGSLILTGTLSPIVSSSLNPALTGSVRLASSDAACWRNAANTADLCLSKNGSDVLLWPNGFSAASLTASGLTVGNCVQATTGGLLTTASGPCGTSSGTITATGSPATGNLTKFSGATSITNGDLSGDCTTSGTLAATCTKTNGTAFAASATTDTTNAANISSGTLAGARLPATTSNCSGVQFAQGLNSGGSPACATPPTFVASGGSHAVGYVPDPGSSAGTTRFLREDATFAVPPTSGVTEATWASSQPQAPGAGATAKTYAEMILPSAHTLIRFIAFLGTNETSCSTTVPVVAFYDETAASALFSITLSNTGSQLYDSGALNVSMTAGHTFSIRITTAGDANCAAAGPATWTAVYK